jgi:hypothetical protein
VYNSGPFTITAKTLLVSSTEYWDGFTNPHAADGVAISGSGTAEDPWTYNIPNGMQITSTGRINLWTPDPGGNQSQNIKFVIQGGICRWIRGPC